jgi:hypothetical protein
MQGEGIASNIKMTKAFHKYYHLIVDEDFSMFLASK